MQANTRTHTALHTQIHDAYITKYLGWYLVVGVARVFTSRWSRSFARARQAIVPVLFLVYIHSLDSSLSPSSWLALDAALLPLDSLPGRRIFKLKVHANRPVYVQYAGLVRSLDPCRLVTRSCLNLLLITSRSCLLFHRFDWENSTTVVNIFVHR